MRTAPSSAGGSCWPGPPGVGSAETLAGGVCPRVQGPPGAPPPHSSPPCLDAGVPISHPGCPWVTGLVPSSADWVPAGSPLPTSRPESRCTRCAPRKCSCEVSSLWARPSLAPEGACGLWVPIIPKGPQALLWPAFGSTHTLAGVAGSAPGGSQHPCHLIAS